MPRNPATMRFRRREYSASMTETVSIGPVSASRAAYCAIEVGFDVDWLCTLIIAEMSGSGARAKPTRHPVMANVFESEPITRIFGLVPATLASDHGFALSYKKCE